MYVEATSITSAIVWINFVERIDEGNVSNTFLSDCSIFLVRLALDALAALL